MTQSDPVPIPLSAREILDMSFLENRARLLEIAAFLDRIDRTADSETGKLDFRYQSLVKGLGLLLEESAGIRTIAIQTSFSDPTTDPLESAIGLKAHGAWDGSAS